MPVTSRDYRGRRARFIAAAAVAALAVALVPSGASGAPRLQKGFWGPTSVNGVSQFPIYRDLGVSIYQTQLLWSTVAPTRPAHPRDPADPAYVWPADIDLTIREAASNAMHVLLLLQGTPPWANRGQPANFAPDRPSDFADFARAAARRYPTVRHWMIWGEPHRVPNFMPLLAQRTLGQALTPGQAAAPRRYARILDAAYGALKAVRPSNLVIGGNTFTGGEIRPRRWVQNMKLPNGRPPRMDLYGHNPFSFRNPDLNAEPLKLDLVDFSDLRRFQKVIDRFLGVPRHKRIRFFLSEFTVATDAPDREFNFHVTRALQATWTKNAFKVSRQVNAYGLGWIHLYDEPPSTDGSLTSHAGLLTFDGQKKPAYFAFKRG